MASSSFLHFSGQSERRLNINKIGCVDEHFSSFMAALVKFQCFGLTKVSPNVQCSENNSIFHDTCGKKIWE